MKISKRFLEATSFFVALTSYYIVWVCASMISENARAPQKS